MSTNPPDRNVIGELVGFVMTVVTCTMLVFLTAELFTARKRKAVHQPHQPEDAETTQIEQEYEMISEEEIETTTGDETIKARLLNANGPATTMLELISNILIVCAVVCYFHRTMSLLFKTMFK